MEDDLSFFENGRRPQFPCKLEDNLNFSLKCKSTSSGMNMEDDINFKVNGRQPFKWKTTSVSYWVFLAQQALASLELGTAQP